jgi:hypothetical protein
MNKTTILGALFVMTAAGTASAGGQEGSIGVGAEFMLSGVDTPMGGPSYGVGGLSLNYDAGMFHVGGALGMSDGGGDDDTNLSIYGRFFYHVHSSAMADFSIGANLGVLSLDGPGDRATLLFLEPALQVRLFIASNVALSLTAGISIGTIDAEGFALGGQTSGAAGFHYYFF